MKANIYIKIGLVAMTALLAAGCSGMGGGQQRRTANLSAFLYSETGVKPEPKPVSALSLPFKVGIAFVPSDGSTNNGFAFASAGPNQASASAGYREANPNYSYPPNRLISENEKLELIKHICGKLGQYPALKSAETVSSDYIVARGGFDNLDRVRALYGLDVIILLSYDQVQFTDEGMLTLSYWTIVGAYVVPGEKIDTKTVMEAAVYDIANRRLLFRASGEGRIKGSSTPINLSEQLREESNKSFQIAATHLAANLTNEGEAFKKQLAANTGEYKTERKPGYTGGPFGEPQ